MKKRNIVSYIVFSALLLFFVLPLSAQQEKTIKRKVAIGRFSNETQYGKSIFFNREQMGKQALDILSTKLAASGKFILLERTDLDILVAEDSLDKIGADYIILGSITQFGRKTEGSSGFFTKTKTQTAEAGVSIRLVEAATGVIIYSDEAKGYAETVTKTVLGFGGSAGHDATLSDKAISAALSQLVENIINKCMDKPWRSYFLSVEDGSYLISGGASQGLSSGDSFTVYKKGKSVKNPQTGMDIELPGTKIGAVTVTRTFGETPESEISFCTYEGEDMDTRNLSDYYITENQQ